MKTLLYSGVAFVALASAASAATCPAVTVSDTMGVGVGAFPQQYELAEFQSLGNCTMEFSGNPGAAGFNAQIQGNGELPSLLTVCHRSHWLLHHMT